jgi:hypothetical protein
MTLQRDPKILSNVGVSTKFLVQAYYNQLMAKNPIIFSKKLLRGQIFIDFKI